jgi:hypothetical protein
MNNVASPVTYGMISKSYEDAGLDDPFMERSNITPNMRVKCNCKFYMGHEPTCDIVVAHDLLKKSKYCKYCNSFHTSNEPHLSDKPYRI